MHAASLLGRRRAVHVVLGLTALAIAAWARAQAGASTDATANAGPGGASTPASASAGASRGVFSLNLVDAPGGVVLDLDDFVHMLNALYPGAAAVERDDSRGMIRITVNDHRFDLLATHGLIVLDGKIQPVGRPLITRQGKTMLPVESAQAILQALNLNFELQSSASKAQAATPAPAVSLAAATSSTATLATPPVAGVAAPPPVVAMSPAAGAVPPVPIGSVTPTPIAVTPSSTAGAAAPTPGLATPTPGPGPAPQPSPSVNLSMLIDKAAATPTPTPALGSAGGSGLPLQPPAGFARQVVGLTWKQLADKRHRMPPERVVLACDPALEAIANAANDQIDKLVAYRSQVVLAPQDRRDPDAFLIDIKRASPELVVFLTAQPSGDADAASPVVVWVAHEALWPRDRASTADADDPALAYRAHQYQNLGLGALLRGELAARFPDRPIVYEMAPDYLLRRVDAPAADVLVPVKGATGAAVPLAQVDRLAQAIAAAVVDYAEGIRGAL
jgi:hypothetical protein